MASQILIITTVETSNFTTHFIHKSKKLSAFAEAFNVDLGYSLLVLDATEAVGSSKMSVPL